MTTISIRLDDSVKKELEEYSEINKDYLRKSDRQIKAGQYIEKTIEELEAMEDIYG